MTGMVTSQAVIWAGILGWVVVMIFMTLRRLRTARTSVKKHTDGTLSRKEQLEVTVDVMVITTDWSQSIKNISIFTTVLVFCVGFALVLIP